MLAELLIALSISTSDIKDLDSDDYKTRIEAVKRINSTVTKENVDDKLEALVIAYKASTSLEQRLLLESALKYTYAVKWWDSIRSDSYSDDMAVEDLEKAFKAWMKIEGLDRMKGLK